MKPRHIVLAIATAWAMNASHAEILSLHAAWQKAAATEPAWRMAQAEADVDKADVDKARSGLLPRIALNSTANKNSLTFVGQPSSNYDSTSTVLSLQQPLFRMQSFSEFQRADTRGELAEFRLSNEAQSLAVRVTQGYFDILQAEDAVRYSGFLERSLTTHVDAARKSFRSGAGTRVEIDEARARLSIAIADRQAAENNLGNARKRLSAIVGSPVTDVLPLDPERTRSFPLVPGSFDTWLEVARQGSPELAVANKSVEEASWGVTSARSGHFPTLDLVLSSSESQSESVATRNSRYNSSTIGVQLNLPIFSGGYTTADTTQATARHQRALASREHIERQLETRLLQEFNGVMQGEERIASLIIALDASEESLRSTRHGVAAGTRTTLDVLNAERQLYSARLDLARARYDWLMSRMRLKALAGKLDEDAIREVSNLLSLAARSAEEPAAEPTSLKSEDSIITRREAIPRDSTLTRKLGKEATATNPTPQVTSADSGAASVKQAENLPAASTPEPTKPETGESTASTVPPPPGVEARGPEALQTAADAPSEGTGTVPGVALQSAAPEAGSALKSPLLVAASSDGKYAVALGTFGNPENVSRMLATAEQNGVPAYTETTDKGLTRVRAGPFGSRLQANQILKKFRTLGVAGIIEKR